MQRAEDSMDKKSIVVEIKAFIPGWIWAALVIAWLLIPLAFSVTSPLVVGQHIAAAGHGILGLGAGVAAWMAGLMALWQLVAFFLRSKLPSFALPHSPWAILLHIMSSIAVLMVPLSHAMVFASRGSYFSSLPWWTYVAAIGGLGWNAYSITRLIRVLSERDVGYREYALFRSTIESPDRHVRGVRRVQGIQSRLTLAFTGLILLVVVVLATSLLRDFGTTLLRAIRDNGGSLADRTSSIVKTSIGDRITLDEYMALEAKKNEKASFPFYSVSYYRRDPKTGAYAVSSSTEESMLGTILGDASAASLRESPSMLEDDVHIEFRAPVTLSGVNLGFVSVIYDRELIYGPYYLTRVKAAIISFFFLYASVFITYLFGRSIVFPILILRMGVNSISTRLASMVKGNERVSADGLHYKDRVVTNDEIKKLSIEIGNMASVIRGVVPYISASTLRHSERGSPMTERRDLAFLFTDIRGFTTICEGQSPEDVVTMLNYYLDIQSTAIVAHGGDIDKFVGDELMAMFDGPDREIRACKAGMAIRKAMADAQEKAITESTAIVSIGIGINTGPVVFGSVGARDRMDFTSIGDTVNLAARLEGANKIYGTKSLISEAVYDKVKDAFLCREIDLIAVKGKTVPVRIFEVLQDAPTASSELHMIKDGFEAGLASYRARRWGQAKKHFSMIRDAYEDETSDVFLKRIEVFEANPPDASWDGVFRMSAK